MRSLAKRQRVLGGALLVALAIWAISSWIGPDKPAAVLAKQSGPRRREADGDCGHT